MRKGEGDGGVGGERKCLVGLCMKGRTVLS